MTSQDAQASNVIVTGILPVCSIDAHVLFDSGSTNSYVSPLFAKNFTMEPVRLETSFLVATTMGETLVVESGYRSCSVLVGKIDTVVDLMLLDMTDFDMILGMDWLVSCHTTLDYHSNAIRFSISGEQVFAFQRDQSEVPYNLISIMSAQHMLRKGCQRFLAFVRDVEKEERILEQVLVASEYPDVFPEELPGLPPDRDIEFNIELVLGTRPISIPPYRMAPAELKEFKEQLQDLLDKSFIRLSYSP